MATTELHQMWDSVAGGWEQHAEFADERGDELTDRLLELVSLQPGDRVLELAGGPGSVGIAAAERVGDEGHVVVSDVAPSMVAVAAKRSAARSLDNVSTKELDLESIDEPDDSYDVVLCREGLMLVPDPARAAAEIQRVLRPRGRLALAVWGPRERNPWLGVIFDSVSEQFGAPVPPPGLPGPFSLDDPRTLESILSEAGFTDVRADEFDVPYHAESAEEWWVRTVALAGPLSAMLAAQPEPVAAELRERATSRISVYQNGAGLDIPGVALVASARA